MKPKAKAIFLPILFISAACSAILMSCNKYEVISVVFKFPKKISESSAVEVPANSKLIWTLEDSGNEAELYGLDADGNIVNTIAISGAKNEDWEDLTSDDAGNLYIGDFGNNENDRKNLSIYKINADDLTQPKAGVAQKVSFYYPAQKEFPPKKSQRIFDSESFFLYQGNFYIFTKNRSSQFDGTTQLFRVPNQPGNHAAVLIDTFKTCDNFNHCAVTSADISPDGSKVAILSADKVWIFTNFIADNYLDGKVSRIDLKSFTQKEGICFISNSQLYITDEKDKKTGGYLYELDLDKLKSKP